MRKRKMTKRTWRSGISGLIVLTPVFIASHALAEGEMSMCPEDLDQNEVVNVKYEYYHILLFDIHLR